MRRLPTLLVASLSALALGCPSEVTVVPGQGGDGGGDSDGGFGTGGSVVVTGGEGPIGGSGGEGGIGQPSDVYPAPHPPLPTVANLGGPVMTAPVIIPVYFAGDDMGLLGGVTQFIDDVGSTNYWKETTAEYGVGPATSLPPVIVNEVPPFNLDDEQIKDWLAAKLNANDPAFPAPSVNTLYAIYYPDGVSITLQGSQSCQAFGAYHNNVRLDAAHGNAGVPYAVMPRCGSFAGFGGVDGLTIPSAHEFIEAATDPLPLDTPAYGQTDNDHIAWAFILGGETTDMCAQSLSSYTSFPGDIDNVVARSWSNQAALASHNPCVPTIGNKPYFNAAPVLEDSVDLGMGFTTKGVTIAPGDSRTIDVKLFSDGPTAPFDVWAEDITYYLGVGGALDISFDEQSGQNGQTLHMTIQVLEQSQYGVEMFMLHANDGVEDNIWIGMVSSF